MAEIAFETPDLMADYRKCSTDDLSNSSSGCSTGDDSNSSGSVEDLSASSCSVDGPSSSGYWEDETDAYTASIELSNNCRQFYHNHVKTTEAFKQQTVKHARRHKKVTTSGIDAAMERLRKEMAELMDQDLSLMEQLLTLNDRIEDMKHHLLYSSGGKSPYASSECFSGSYASLYDSRVFDENEVDDVRDHVVHSRPDTSLSTCRQSLADADINVAVDNNENLSGHGPNDETEENQSFLHVLIRRETRSIKFRKWLPAPVDKARPLSPASAILDSQCWTA